MTFAAEPVLTQRPSPWDQCFVPEALEQHTADADQIAGKQTNHADACDSVEGDGASECNQAEEAGNAERSCYCVERDVPSRVHPIASVAILIANFGNLDLHGIRT
jgi:hypothetical protein